jgi:hypothetical protein
MRTRMQRPDGFIRRRRADARPPRRQPANPPPPRVGMGASWPSPGRQPSGLRRPPLQKPGAASLMRNREGTGSERAPCCAAFAERACRRGAGRGSVTGLPRPSGAGAAPLGWRQEGGRSDAPSNGFGGAYRAREPDAGEGKRLAGGEGRMAARGAGGGARHRGRCLCPLGARSRHAEGRAQGDKGRKHTQQPTQRQAGVENGHGCARKGRGRQG